MKLHNAKILLYKLFKIFGIIYIFQILLFVFAYWKVYEKYTKDNITIELSLPKVGIGEFVPILGFVFSVEPLLERSFAYMEVTIRYNGWSYTECSDDWYSIPWDKLETRQTEDFIELCEPSDDGLNRCIIRIPKDCPSFSF